MWRFCVCVCVCVCVHVCAENMDGGEEGGDGEEDGKAAIFSKISAHTIKQILELLCDESVSCFSHFCNDPSYADSPSFNPFTAMMSLENNQ